MSWSSAQYGKFEAERNRPIHDLIAQIPNRVVATAIDIGCGPGNSTEFLARRYPDATITGMDSSPDMIEAARKRLPDISFTVEDIAAWALQPGTYDVIFANAALQWVPDHERLIPALLARLSPGGTLAVQMPDNLAQPAHVLMREIAADGPWAAKLADASNKRAIRHDAAWYYALLRDHAAHVDVWMTTFHHALPGGAASIVEWFKGTGLRPFIQPLDDDERAAFLARYEKALASAYTIFPDGTALLPFPRLFFVATI
jgi:trans-aconitate 2-methyltransferase